MFPMSVISLSTGAIKKINPSPSATFFRDLYEHFIDKQRRMENSQYARTLAGMSYGLHCHCIII